MFASYIFSVGFYGKKGSLYDRMGIYILYVSFVVSFLAIPVVSLVFAALALSSKGYADSSAFDCFLLVASAG